MVHAYEGDVLNFMRNVLAGIARDRGFKFARQIMKLLAWQVVIFNLLDGRGGVDNLVLGHTCNWRAQNDAGNVATPH